MEGEKGVLAWIDWLIQVFHSLCMRYAMLISDHSTFSLSQ